MPNKLFLVEESVIKQTIPRLKDDHPVWLLFEDGPVQRLQGEVVQEETSGVIKTSVRFDLPRLVPYGGYTIEWISLPLSILQEIEDDAD